MNGAQSKLLIRGGRVYDHDGDVHQPDTADILIEGSEITAVGTDLSSEQTAGAELPSRAPGSPPGGEGAWSCRSRWARSSQSRCRRRW